MQIYGFSEIWLWMEIGYALYNIRRFPEDKKCMSICIYIIYMYTHIRTYIHIKALSKFPVIIFTTMCRKIFYSFESCNFSFCTHRNECSGPIKDRSSWKVTVSLSRVSLVRGVCYSVVWFVRCDMFYSSTLLSEINDNEISRLMWNSY
jgi:hypothetical protein